jgi:hypothetical protein
VISPEDQEAIDLELKELREDNSFGTEEEYDCVRAMLSGLALHSNNPDKVAKATGISRTKIREWFQNLRNNKVIEVGPNGRSTGVWRVNWFEEHGRMALILDTLIALGFIRRVEDEVDPEPSSNVSPP